jgi:hypothetical protein
MPHIDQIVLTLLALSLVGSIVFQARRGARGGRLAVAALATFYGLVLVTMLGGHCADVLYGLTHHLTSIHGQPFAYEWRTYSLLLFGVLLVRLGARCVVAAASLGRGAAEARAAFLRTAATVLVIVVPIIPIHAFFGWLITGMTLLALTVVAAFGRARVPAAMPLVPAME